MIYKNILIAITGSILALGVAGSIATRPFNDLVSELKQEEGFRAKPYADTRGVLTIGYGTNFSNGITPKEGELLLRERLNTIKECIDNGWPPFEKMPTNIKFAILDMGYQLGCRGLLKFDTMLGMLASGDYKGARDDALKTVWAEETSERAKRVTDKFLIESKND